MQKEDFSVRLKKIRIEKKMTQKEFSDFLNIRQQTLSGYETGKISPSLDIAKEISVKIGISLDWLCGLSENRNSNNKFQNYSQVLDALIKIDEAVQLKVKKIKLHSYTENVICINDGIIQSFLEEWGKIVDLFHKEIVNKELYDLWVKDRLKSYSVPLNNEAEYLDFLDMLDAEKRG